MASQSLYRKWRSQDFAEVVGQEPITLTLRNSLSTGRLAHAYLFCGPRGTGKTSTGRILAKALNCRERQSGEPCNTCDMCVAVMEGRALDLIEIDAASNRGIDEIRDLREKVKFAPSQGRYKVYIIDEVHMLTNEAFNALLKTLEEPPAHIVFVLCTTEAHKVPATILSRCQRFDFRRIALPAAVGRLRHICEHEGIAIDDAGLELVAKASMGSLRDAENLLDQLVAYYGNQIQVAQVRDLLGVAGDARLFDLAGDLVRGDLTAGLHIINDVVADGLELRQFNRDLVDYLRRLLLVKVGSASLIDASSEEMVDLEALARSISVNDLLYASKLFSQLDLRYDGQSPLPLELAFVECLLERGKVPDQVQAEQARAGHAAAERPVTEGRASERRPGPPVETAGDNEGRRSSHLPAGVNQGVPAEGAGSSKEGLTASSAEAKPAGQPAPLELADADPTEFVKANWSQVLDLLRVENKVLETYIVDRNGSGPFAVEGDKIVLGVGYDVHKTTLEKPQARRIVEDILSRVLGKKYVIQCVVLPKNNGERQRRAAEDPLIQEALKHGARIAKVE